MREVQTQTRMCVYPESSESSLLDNALNTETSCIGYIRNSEHDQEIQQSQIADITRKSHATITRHQEDELSKATSTLFPIKIGLQN